MADPHDVSSKKRPPTRNHRDRLAFTSANTATNTTADTTVDTTTTATTAVDTVLGTTNTTYRSSSTFGSKPPPIFFIGSVPLLHPSHSFSRSHLIFLFTSRSGCPPESPRETRRVEVGNGKEGATESGGAESPERDKVVEARGFSSGTRRYRRRDATGGRFETLDLRSVSPTKFKVRPTSTE
ncbi:hypothetical protein KM043_000364 [Ampulex compressa]|nr:hypothetical protein KM043_000364 [Ampulex compressa]